MFHTRNGVQTFKVVSLNKHLFVGPLDLKPYYIAHLRGAVIDFATHDVCYCLQYPEPRFVSIPDVDKIFRSSTYLMRESCDLRDDYHFLLLKFKVIHN